MSSQAGDIGRRAGDVDRPTQATGLVAGIGFSSRAQAGDIVQAVRTALAAHGCDGQALVALASLARKRGDPALAQAARLFGVPAVYVDDEDAHAASARGGTKSQRSIRKTGLPSACEAAALAGAGDGSRLLGPRFCLGPVTCALATSSGLRWQGGSRS